ncbi:hypothetical protein ACFVU3_27355 [Streptomyces sp. NPDC058052]
MGKALCTRLFVAVAVAVAGLLPVAASHQATADRPADTVLASPGDDNGWW